MKAAIEKLPARTYSADYRRVRDNEISGNCGSLSRGIHGYSSLPTTNRMNIEI